MTKYNTRRGQKNYGKPFTVPYLTLTGCTYSIPSLPKFHTARGGMFRLDSSGGSLTVTQTATIP